MPFLRFSRDKRGYEHVYLVHAANRRGKPSRPRVLYWYRSPPGIKVGRRPFDEEVRRTLEAQNPGVIFDWKTIVATPMPPPEPAEHWRERRRIERAVKQAQREDEAEAETATPFENLTEAPLETREPPSPFDDASASLAVQSASDVWQSPEPVARLDAFGAAGGDPDPTTVCAEPASVTATAPATSFPASGDSTIRKRRRRGGRRRRGRPDVGSVLNQPATSRVEPARSIEQERSTEPFEPVEPFEPLELVELFEPVELVEAVELLEPVEPVEAVEPGKE